MDIIKLIDKYTSLGIPEVIDHEKFNLISIVHHSTSIEGSTLTEVETQVILSEGLTPKGKPMHDSLMVTDHYKALEFALSEAERKRSITPTLIQEINALVNQSTGVIYNTIFGTTDARTGAFRKDNVSAGTTYFPNFDKVKRLTTDMVAKINKLMSSDLGVNEQLDLSFDAHFNLVSIHPFYDGNGRTSRLLMNYIQRFYDLPLSSVFNESKTDYIQALRDTRQTDDIEIFRSFMREEYKNYLQSEIQKFEDMNKPKHGKGFNLLF